MYRITQNNANFSKFLRRGPRVMLVYLGDFHKLAKKQQNSENNNTVKEKRQDLCGEIKLSRPIL